MDDIKLEIKDYYELLNLHKALIEAKFHRDPDNKYVAGSPIIAKLCNEIVSLLTQYDIQRKGKEDWTIWRQLHNQEYFKERALEGIKRFGVWEKLSLSKKKDSVLNYISPFVCTDDEIESLIKEIDDLMA